MLTRRKMLASVAATLPLAALAACSPAEVAVFQQDWTSFVSNVQGAVATVTGVVPTIESVAATLAALFGPEWSATVALGTSVLNAVIAAIEAAIAAASTTPTTRARLARSSPNLPVVIGVLPNGVRLTGYRA